MLASLEPVWNAGSRPSVLHSGMRFVAGILLCTLPLLSESFSYPDFRSTNGLALVKDARTAGPAVRVAPARNNRSGAVWYREPVAVGVIEYQPPMLAVFLDDRKEPIVSAAIDMTSVAGEGGKAYVGFTAGTGGAYQNHDVLNWSFGPATAVDSNMSVVSSAISYRIGYSCIPKHTLCTPDRAVVESTDGVRYRIVLPANKEWAASIPNESLLPLRIENATGLVCWDPSLGNAACNGPAGSKAIKGSLLLPGSPAASLVLENRNGRTYFSINDRAAHDNEGFFEFEVVLDSPYSR